MSSRECTIHGGVGVDALLCVLWLWALFWFSWGFARDRFGSEEFCSEPRARDAMAAGKTPAPVEGGTVMEEFPRRRSN